MVGDGTDVYVRSVLEMIPRTVGGEAIHREVDGFDEPGDFCKTVYTYYN